MVYLDSLGITENDNLSWLLSMAEGEGDRRFFYGYNSIYICREIGQAEIITNVIEDKDGKFDTRGGSTHVKGGHEYTMRVEERVAGRDDTETIYVCSSLTGRGSTIAVNTVCGDMLPQFQGGDVITFQGIGFLYKSFELCLSKTKAEKLFTKNGYIPDDGQILSGVPQESLFNLVYAKVKSYRTLPFFEERLLHAIEIDSDIGELTLIVPPSYLNIHRGILGALEKGRDVYVIGMFYLSGSFKSCLERAPADEDNLLRLVRASLSDGDYTRIMRHIAPGCVLNGFDLSGSVEDVLAKTFGKDIRTELATVTKLLLPEKAIGEPGKRILIAHLPSSSVALLLDTSYGKINAFNLVRDNIYQFRLDEAPESAEEAARKRETYYSESSDGWYDLLCKWLSDDKSVSMCFFFGIDPACVTTIGGKNYEGRDESYLALHDYVDEHSDGQRLEKDMVRIRTGVKGTIKQLVIL